MGVKRSFFAFLLLVLAACANPAFAQTVIECTVSYAYADKKKAIREQVWEEGWTWDVESDDDFQIAKKTATSVHIQSSASAPQGTCGIVFKNRFGQQHHMQLDMKSMKRDKKGRVFVTLLKTYNKIILKNRAGVEVSGEVYFGPSGVAASDLEGSANHIKCPPAAGGGYSFPSILQKQENDYSVYVIGSKGNCIEMTFSEKKWYGVLIVEAVKIN